ncbi:MAG: hypothetical protein ABF381_08895 [Akkermansiaceae bacterium]
MTLRLTIFTFLLGCSLLWAKPKESQKNSQPTVTRNTFMVFGNTYITKLETKTSILASINKAVKDAEIDFVIMVGELTMSATPEQFQAVQFVIENSPVPVHVTASNHDLTYDNGDWKTGKPDDYAHFRKMLETETEYTLTKGRSHFIMQSRTDETGTDFTKKALAKIRKKTDYDFVYHVMEASLGAEIDRKNEPIIGINGGTREVKYHVIADRHVKVIPIENKETDKEDDYLIFKENDGYAVVDSYVDRRLDQSFKIVIDRAAGTCSVEK